MVLGGREIEMIKAIAWYVACVFAGFSLGLQVGKYGVRVGTIFAWYDFWVGLYYDRRAKMLYVFPIPMFGLTFRIIS